MISNSRMVPGVLPSSFECAHNPTQTARELFLYVEYIGRSYLIETQKPRLYGAIGTLEIL